MKEKSELPSEKLLSPPASCGECKQAQALPLPWLGAIPPPTGVLALAQGSCWLQNALYPTPRWAVEPWMADPSQGSDSAPVWDGRAHVALPTPGTRGWGRVAHVPQLTMLRLGIQKTPTRQVAGNPGMDLKEGNQASCSAWLQEHFQHPDPSQGARDSSQHTCATQPSHGQSWEQQSRIPQETARTYHTRFII